jgi:hypothetical protein
MPIVKVIEVIASSDKSFDDAVKHMKAHVKDGKIKSYGVICKVSFRLDKDKKDKDEKNEK